MIDKLKKRFEFINENDVWPYLENVINRIPDKDKDKLLNDKKIEIITINKERGCQIPFKNPIESLIYLIWPRISGLSDLEKTYGVAHEIAHHFADRGETGLREKEADDLLIKWGFEKEIEASGHLKPYFENKGYNIGYEGAKKELSPSNTQWFPILCMFIDDWKNDTLTLEQETHLKSFINTTSMVDKIYEESDKGNINDEHYNSLEKGVVYGIMHKVKELEGKKLRNEFKSKYRGK